MTSIIEKRRSLHRNLEIHRKKNDKLKFQVSQLQALSNIGTTTCMIAHEINNLLTPLSCYAELALRNPDDKSLSEKALKKTQQNCDRATKIMKSILAVANGETQQKEDVRLVDSIEEIFSCLCRDFQKDSITVDIQIPEDLTIWAVPVEIQQVLMNLILNARDAMLGRGGTLAIKARNTDDTVQIEVSDTGCGIEYLELNKIFEPFYTTKKDNSMTQNSGSGLGLAFCKKIVDAYNGSIYAESTPNVQTTFIITLPLSQ